MIVPAVPLADALAGVDEVEKITVPDAVNDPLVRGASALSSASLTASVVELRLREGKLDVVPPNCSLLKSVVAAFESLITPSDGDSNDDLLDQE